MTLGFFEQFLTIICCAVVAITLFRRIALPPLLAYLSVGALLGPYSIGLVEDTHSIELLSELGVVFLLFMLGLEFSVSRMFAMRRAVFGLGTLQVVFTSLALIAICILLGQSLTTALVIAGALSLSSTAIVSKELIQRNELDTPHGQLSVGTLIFQDLAAVFFLILIPALSGSTQQEVNAATIVLMLLEGATILIILLLVGRIIMPMLFHESAHSGSSEVFVLTTLVAALLAAWLTHVAGLSMALGGFLAGMMLGESRYRYQLEADIRPFRDVLLGLFFVSVGMQLDLIALYENWYWVIVFTLALIVLKTLIITALGSMIHNDPANAMRAGLSLSQGGEFGFALLALAIGNQLISPEVNAIAVTTIIISMIITPMLMNHTDRLSRWLHSDDQTTDDRHLPEALAVASHSLDQHVIICGFGRVGQVITRFLDPMSIPYIVLDNDPVRVMEASTAGENICFGDAKRSDVIEALGGDRARMLIITSPDPEDSLKALKHLRVKFPALPILVRTQDDSQLEMFQESGATEIIPEALEGSLMLVSHVLSLLKVPHSEIERQINQVRSERYSMLHGYYHGGHSDKMDASGRMKEILHPVPLDESSFANNKKLRDLPLAKYDMKIAMVRRDEKSIHDPVGDTVLKVGDIVILQGPSDKIDIGEAILISGK